MALLFRTPFDSIEDPTGFDPPIYPQAQLDPVDFYIAAMATGGEGVLSGCEVSASSPEALTVDVASGQIVLAGNIIAVSAQPNVAIATPNVTQPRQDLVVADDAGIVSIVDGLPASISPLFPSVPADSVALAAIYVPASLAEVTADHISGRGWPVELPPASTSDWTPVRATADLTRNNDASLTADTVLKFTMTASTKYAVRGHVVISVAAASDLRAGFLGPASPTFLSIQDLRMGGQLVTPGSPAGFQITAYDTTGRVTGSTGSQLVTVDFQAIIHNGSNTSPDFSFAWGQQTAVAENTVRRAGSYLEYVAL